MSRTTIQRVSEPRSKQALSGLVMAGIAVVLLFAVIGVVSAGSFVASRMSSSTPPTTKHRGSRSATTRTQELSRARAQASAIVQSARAASNSIISRATVRAHHQANTILAGARHKAAAIVASAPGSSTSSGSASTGSSSSATGSSQATGATSSGTTTFIPTPTPVPASSSAGSTGGASASAAAAGQSPATSAGATSSTPDLSTVPASWKVVGYNATFGSGPGSAGSITVTNRGAKTYAGTATVTYNSGGSASASFSGLAPGETVVLPLDGAAYGGGGYQIGVNVG